jgi:hypothetical protein
MRTTTISASIRRMVGISPPDDNSAQDLYNSLSCLYYLPPVDIHIALLGNEKADASSL